MSNPYLKSDDPRFQQKTPLDSAGNNRFADDEIVPAELASGEKPTATSADNNLFAAPVSGGSAPYQPAYIAVSQPRIRTLAVLAGAGVAAIVAAPFALMQGSLMGWGILLFSFPPCVACIFLAYADLRAMEMGAMHTDKRNWVRTLFFASLAATIGTLLAIAGLAYVGIQMFPFLAE